MYSKIEREIRGKDKTLGFGYAHFYVGMIYTWLFLAPFVSPVLMRETAKENPDKRKVSSPHQPVSRKWKRERAETRIEMKREGQEQKCSVVRKAE